MVMGQEDLYMFSPEFATDDEWSKPPPATVVKTCSICGAAVNFTNEFTINAKTVCRKCFEEKCSE
jgi:formylmethanofuran dehydrogenase subunit E